MVSVLFVCTGNICRSPTAHGIFDHMVQAAGLADAVRVDSCGTHGYHVGDPPDGRSQAAARKRGYDLAGLRARRLVADDFRTFDLLLAMDRGHLEEMDLIRPAGAAGSARLFLDFAPRFGKDVPDPYYGGSGGFEAVLDMVEEGCASLLDHVKTRL